MQFSELALVGKIGRLFTYAMENRKYNRYEFIKKWLASETYNLTVNFAVHLCSQSKIYILESFEEEFKGNLPSIDEDSRYYGDDMEWFGYVAAYWFFLDGTTGRDILDTIDVNRVLDAYDVLHTVSVKLAIEMIKEDDKL